MSPEVLRNLFESLSSFIQEHTSVVCSSCEKVCCINKHGRHDPEDILFISAIGIELLPYEPDRRDEDPCRFLGSDGCSLERWMRPFRCTWYFCEPLLKSIGEDGGKAHREFVGSLQKLVSIRQKLIGL